ncbi:MAG: superoxide dismutase family protein [Proteobacteria bacterium]|nr:superoxide dismutase family protein [Pseudomonadota bacterium]
MTRKLQYIGLLISVFSASCGWFQSVESETPEDKAPSKSKKTEPDGGAASGPSLATAILMPMGDSISTGLVTFTHEKGKIYIDAEFHGLPVGKYGFYILKQGDCSDQVPVGADGAKNSEVSDGGVPEAIMHPDMHPDGNLGSLEADETGTSLANLINYSLSLDGSDSIIGRSLIIQTVGDNPENQSGSDAGTWLACGVIRPD